MAKAGKPYQKLVEAVAKALDSGADVREGTWVRGPDGLRELDVEVRGTANGASIFVLIECKDERRPIGIETVDALESKARDLSADRAVLYSNSGFTNPALHKAARVGIQVASALHAGDRRVRVQVSRHFVAKRLSVDTWRLFLHSTQQANLPGVGEWLPNELLYQDKPLVNWLCPRTRDLLREHEGASTIRATFTFPEEVPFSLRSEQILLRGFTVELECSRSWVAQDVGVDVTLGMADHITGRVMVPDKQAYILGPSEPVNRFETV